MTFLSKLWDLVKSPSAMAVLAVVGFGLAIYQGFFYEKKGELLISVNSLSRVFDIHQPVGGLDISYAGENLRSSKKALWVMHLTIKNSGNAEIKKADFDEQVPFGFQVIGAEVVEKPLLKTTIDYLTQNLKVAFEKNRVLISPVILEPEDTFQLSVLLLGSEASRPSITPFGKIAGIRYLGFITPDEKASGKPFWKGIVEADALWVHPARMFFYGVGLIVSIGLIVAVINIISIPFKKISGQRAINRRRQSVMYYRKNDDLGRDTRVLLDIYVAHGEKGIRKVKKVLEVLNYRRELVQKLTGNVEEQTLHEILHEFTYLTSSEQELGAYLRTCNLIDFNGLEPIFSPTLERSLEELIEYLKIKISKYERRNIFRHVDNAFVEQFLTFELSHSSIRQIKGASDLRIEEEEIWGRNIEEDPQLMGYIRH